MIPTTDIGFAKPKNWSSGFRDFVAQCLVRDPRKRPSAEQMLQHWFADQPLDDEQRATLRYALGPGSNATPAFLEGLCADHDDVQSLLQALERRATAMWNKGTLAGRVSKDESDLPPRTPPEVERRRRWGFPFRASSP